MNSLHTDMDFNPRESYSPGTNADSRPRVPVNWRATLVSIFDKLLVKISGTNNVDILEINSLISACSGGTLYATNAACLKLLALKKAVLLGNGKMKKSCLMNSCLISIFFSFSQLQREPVLGDVSSPYRMFTDMLRMSNWWSLSPNPTEGQIFSHFIEVNNRLMTEAPFSNGIDINDLFRGLFLGRGDNGGVPTKNNILFGVWNRAYQYYADFFEASGFYSGVKEDIRVRVDEPTSSGESSTSNEASSGESSDPIAVITDEEMVF